MWLENYYLATWRAGKRLLDDLQAAMQAIGGAIKTAIAVLSLTAQSVHVDIVHAVAER